MESDGDVSVDKTITVPGLSDDEGREVNALLEQLHKKTRRNLVRKSHYEMKHSVRQVAAVLPPAYASLASTLGWSAKAVDALARRCKVKAFTWTDGDIGSLGADEVWAANSLESEYGQGFTSSLLHASAFISTTEGDESAGEPKSSIHFFDALDATGMFNARTRLLDSALTVDGRDSEGEITALTFHVPGRVRSIRKQDGKWEVVSDSPHDYGMTVDLLPYRPRTGRPFGSSRLSRAMMAISDMAMRELLRLEGHMDVYSFPELWMLGADLSIFGANADYMKVMLGRLKGIPDNPKSKRPDGGRVDVKQITASSPEPHLAALNAYAKLFARESGLPDTSLAITDFANPPSAEAYDASQYDLIAEGEGAVDDWTPALVRSQARALAIKNDDPSLIKTLESGLRPKWRNPKYESRAAEADAGLKQLQAMPWLAETEVGLELLGLSEDQMRRALAERERSRVTSLATELLAGDPSGGDQREAATSDPASE